jgi:hypothetical protein
MGFKKHDLRPLMSEYTKVRGRTVTPLTKIDYAECRWALAADAGFPQLYSFTPRCRCYDFKSIFAEKFSEKIGEF